MNWSKLRCVLKVIAIFYWHYFNYFQITRPKLTTSRYGEDKVLTVLNLKFFIYRDKQIGFDILLIKVDKTKKMNGCIEMFILFCSWPRFDLKGTWDLPTNVAPSTPMHLRNRASQGRRQTLLVQKKRLFKCPFLLQSTSWLTVRFLLDYNTSSNFWIKIWSNFADFIKEESFCRQQSFDLAIMYEINEGVFFTSVECDSMYVRCVGSYISMNNV